MMVDVSLKLIMIFLFPKQGYFVKKCNTLLKIHGMVCDSLDCL